MDSFEAVVVGDGPSLPSKTWGSPLGDALVTPGTRRDDWGPDRHPRLAARLAGLGARVRSLLRNGRGWICGHARRADASHPDPTVRSLDGIDFTQAYWGRSVMITGAGGSIGLELCRQILAAGPRRIVLFELGEHALYTAERTVAALIAACSPQPDIDVRAVLGSVTDAALVAQVLRAEAVTDVLHAAAYKHVHLVEANPRAGLVNNTLGTAVLAQAARDCGVQRFVLVSTDKAVRPAGIMGASKRLAEVVVQDLASRPGPTVYSVVRFGNVIASSGSVIPLFSEQIAAGGPVTLTHPDTTRYFMTLTDAAQLVLAAGSLARGGEIFLLDMGRPVLIRDLAVRMIAAAGRTVRDAANPSGEIALVTTCLRPGEKLHEDLTTGLQVEKTRHPKILRLTEGSLSELETAAALRDIRCAVETGSDLDLRAVAKRWVTDRGVAPGIVGPSVNGADRSYGRESRSQAEVRPRTLSRGAQP